MHLNEYIHRVCKEFECSVINKLILSPAVCQQSYLQACRCIPGTLLWVAVGYQRWSGIPLLLGEPWRARHAVSASPSCRLHASYLQGKIIQRDAIIAQSIFSQMLTKHPIAREWGRGMGCLSLFQISFTGMFWLSCWSTVSHSRLYCTAL